MIKNDIQKAVLESLKGNKKTELKVLRFILSLINYEEIAKQRQLTDEETILLLTKEVKKRQEAVEMFKKGKRSDLVSDEEQQITVIRRYLPKPLKEEELSKIVAEVIASRKDKTSIGEIIGEVMGKVKGRAEGKMVSNLVRQTLAQK